MSRMTGAELLADALKAYDVTHVFFVPTILSRTLVELERRTDIRRILTHGEKAAAYMADGFARACGRPGVCLAQTVGAANLAAGLRDPYLACSPVVALTGGPYKYSRHRHTYQEIEDLPLFRAVTKFSAHVDGLERVPDLFRQAFRAATSGKPGPVHLEFEGHLGEVFEVEEGDVTLAPEPRFSEIPAFRWEADRESVCEALDILSTAERPIIIAGGGVRAAQACQELVVFAERYSIPVATSLNAKEVIPADHPLSVGVVGLYSRESANRAVLESDVVFFIGSKTGSQVTANWKVPPPSHVVVQLDIDPEELGRHYPNRVSLLGDAKMTLHAMAAGSSPSTQILSDRGMWVAHVQKLVHGWRERYEPVMVSADVPIRPERLCRDLSTSLPDDAILVSDTGHSGMWTGGMVDLAAPGQSYIRCAGSLGWGLPAAIGAKLAAATRPVLLFTGDGGLWYHIGELETAVRANINVVIVVNNNRSLNQEIGIYSEAYGGTLHGKHAELWHFEDVNFARLAESIGSKGIRVTKPGHFVPALEEAFASAGPVVIDVVTDITALAPLAYLGEP